MYPLNCRTESLLLCFLILLGIVTISMSSSFSGPTVKQVGMNMFKAAPLIVPGDYSSRTISDQVATKPPVIQGWGGVTLDEASNGQMQSTPKAEPVRIQCGESGI